MKFVQVHRQCGVSFIPCIWQLHSRWLHCFLWPDLKTEPFVINKFLFPKYARQTAKLVWTQALAKVLCYICKWLLIRPVAWISLSPLFLFISLFHTYSLEMVGIRERKKRERERERERWSECEIQDPNLNVVKNLWGLSLSRIVLCYAKINIYFSRQRSKLVSCVSLL